MRVPTGQVLVRGWVLPQVLTEHVLVPGWYYVRSLPLPCRYMYEARIASGCTCLVGSLIPGLVRFYVSRFIPAGSLQNVAF
jgi:hypothetical protein